MASLPRIVSLIFWYKKQVQILLLKPKSNLANNNFTFIFIYIFISIPFRSFLSSPLFLLSLFLSLFVFLSLSPHISLFLSFILVSFNQSLSVPFTQYYTHEHPIYKRIHHILLSFPLTLTLFKPTQHTLIHAHTLTQTQPHSPRHSHSYITKCWQLASFIIKPIWMVCCFHLFHLSTFWFQMSLKST